jgi:hypothetical protein
MVRAELHEMLEELFWLVGSHRVIPNDEHRLILHFDEPNIRIEDG